jgi:hypothetical protein|tara:strand:+ start:109 stop:357 length:249 start_codon:yes stop_codon:yes gene_type:complete
MSEENHQSNIEDLDEGDLGEIINVICTDGYYPQAEIVEVSCPACGEKFLGTKRHAGGFIAGHKAFHEFENSMDLYLDSVGGV